MVKNKNNFIARAHNTNVNSVVGIGIILFLAIATGLTIWIAHYPQILEQWACSNPQLCKLPPPPPPPPPPQHGPVPPGGSGGCASDPTGCFHFCQNGYCFWMWLAGPLDPYNPNPNSNNPQNPVNHNNSNGYDPSHMRPGGGNFGGNTNGSSIIKKH